MTKTSRTIALAATLALLSGSAFAQTASPAASQGNVASPGVAGSTNGSVSMKTAKPTRTKRMAPTNGLPGAASGNTATPLQEGTHK